MRKCKLGDLFEIKQGYAFKSEKYQSAGKYVLCTLGNISADNNFKYDLSKANYYPDDFSHTFILEEGDLIIPLTEQAVGLFGNTAFIPLTNGFQFVLNQRVGKVIPKKAVADKYYLHYLLSTELVRNQIEATATGTSQRNTSPEKIYDVTVWVPDIEQQRKIGKTLFDLERKVNINKLINDNLEATAQAYFDNLFFSCDDTDCTLADIALVNPSRPLSKGVEARCFDMSTLPTSGCIPTGDTTKPYNGGVRFINGDTLIARITPCLENGKAAYINILNEGEVAFGSTEYIVFASKDDIPSCFYYFLIRNSKFVTFALQFMNGSSGRQRVSGEELASFPLMIPSKEKLAAFNKVGKLVLEQMKESTEEIQFLKQLQETITATLSSN